MATDRNLQNLIINKLTKEQYDAIDSPSPDELYLIPDEYDNVPTQGSENPVKSGGVFSALAEKYTKPANGIPASDLAPGVIPTVPTDIVKYTAQTLTDAQKAQARMNIGATDQEVFWVTYNSAATPKASKTWVEIFNAASANKIPVLVENYTSYYFVGVSQVDYSLNFAVNVDGKIRNWSVSANDEWTLTELSPESTSNKVTSWQNTPDNTHFPSEKLVKDSLDGKQPTIDANHKLAYSLLSGTPPEIFPVTYGTTTQSQIATAIAAGKLPVCKYGDNVYVYAGESSADYSQFTSVLYDTAYRIYVKNSTWGNGSYEIYSKPSGGIPASDLASGVVPSTYAGSPTAGGFANKAVAIPFGEVDSTSTATEITATVDNFPTTLTDGVCAYIRNDVIASASGFTLNINGTGAKPVYQTLSDESRASTVFSAAVTYLFIYNSTRVEGGCWDIYYGYNANDNTIGYNLRTNTMSLPTTSACYRYRLLFTSADGTHFVPANASSSTNATATRTTTQTPIDPFGSIRYYSYTTAVTSGSRPGVTYLWEQYVITLGYSFNRTGAALTLTAWKPVYIKCAPQADGSAIIDADNPYVQDLPTTADGKIYIFLGVATEATKVEMVFHHPVYYHDGTCVRLWTGIGIDSTPTQNSKNLVTSGGIYDAIQNAGGGGGTIPELRRYDNPYSNNAYFVRSEVEQAITNDTFFIYEDNAILGKIIDSRVLRVGEVLGIPIFASISQGSTDDMLMKRFLVGYNLETAEPTSLEYLGKTYNYNSSNQRFEYTETS